MIISERKMNFDHAAIVVAHPDDEILWFSSIIKKVNKIVVCFLDVKSKPQWSKGRRRSLTEYPLKNIYNLGFDESEVFNQSNWNDVEPVKYGIRIQNVDDAYKIYLNNFEMLQKSLCGLLEGCQDIFTHNPWGEYGHEEHVQVFKAIEVLQAKLGYNIWYSNYCSNKSIKFMTSLIADKNYSYLTLKTDVRAGKIIEEIYKKNECWTWYDDWEFFREESFIKYGSADQPYQYGHNFPINMINVNIPEEKKKTIRDKFIFEIKKMFGIRPSNILKKQST